MLEKINVFKRFKHVISNFLFVVYILKQKILLLYTSSSHEECG